MINTIQKFFKLLLIFSAVITGWTSIILLSNTTFNLEIKELITKMYLNQKQFILNVKDLSLLLLKDANHRFSENSQSMTQLKNVKNQINKIQP